MKTYKFTASKTIRGSNVSHSGNVEAKTIKSALAKVRDRGFDQTWFIGVAKID